MPELASASLSQGTLRPTRARHAHRHSTIDCAWCDAHPDTHCPSCTTRRKHAVRLVVDEHLAVTAAADRLHLSPARVERLLEEDADRRQLEAHASNAIDNAVLRELLAKRQRVEPSLTASEIAHRLGTSQAQVERWLGLRETAPKRSSSGKYYAPRLLEHISVESAGRIARALGFLPCEIEGC